MKPETVTSFVRSLEIEDDIAIANRSDTRSGAEPAGPSFAAGPQALVVGSQMVEFSGGVSPGLREQISNSLLLAQLGANKLGATPAEWREAYRSILLGTGWVWEGSTVGMQSVDQTDLDVHRAIIPVLTGLLGPAAAAASVVISVLNGLAEMNQDTPWLKLFHRETRRASVSQFQVGFVDAESGEFPRMTLVLFELNLTGEVTQVLFFKFAQAQGSLMHNKTELSVNPGLFAEIADVVREKVVRHVRDFILGIELASKPAPAAAPAAHRGGALPKTTADFPPEQPSRGGTESLSMEDAAQTEDVGAQPGPEDFEARRSDSRSGDDLDSVRWPSEDSRCPDYAYLADVPSSANVVLNAQALEFIIAANRYDPWRESGVIAFALRGARLVRDHEVENADTVHLEVSRPDHRSFQCVIGFYFLATQKITAFTGSTVPCRRAIYNYKHGGASSNMLPTGCYNYFIWRHKQIRPALRLAKSSRDPESGGPATVLRNKDNYQIEVTDPFSLSTPYDNIHCAYYVDENDSLGASFSSWGCLTVRGKSTPASHQWAKFQAVLSSLGERARVDLVLATGKDCGLASDDALCSRLVTLRHGSRGEEVLRLQKQLGIETTGYFGASTLDAFTAAQRRVNADAGLGRIADGIYSPAFEVTSGWQVFWPAEDAEPIPVCLPDSGGSAASESPEVVTEEDEADSDFRVNPPGSELRGIPLEELLASEPSPQDPEFMPPTPSRGGTRSGPVRFYVSREGDAQAENTKYFVTDSDTNERWYVGNVKPWPSNRLGISRYSSEMKYDRNQAVSKLGQWAHFIWPTVMAEGNGNHLVINCWDRAQFTWGFYQLAAHTAGDNLILLMRKLVELPSAARYFPDLKVENGKLGRLTSRGWVTLERELEVTLSNGTKEMQLPDFMAYLNPSSTKVEDAEVITAAKFLSWARTDPAMIETTIEVAGSIMLRKIKRFATNFSLNGKRPELGIWVSDISHQGRGKNAAVVAALAHSRFEDQLEALSKIDVYSEKHPNGQYKGRRATVKKHVDILIQEGRFSEMKIGEGDLKFP